jgi:TATA-box binding protein (TBP) (component of TFIID and TFIIIB)
MRRSRAIIRIENVVASATLDRRVDLNALLKDYPSLGYQPGKFPDFSVEAL